MAGSGAADWEAERLDGVGSKFDTRQPLNHRSIVPA